MEVARIDLLERRLRRWQAATVAAIALSVGAVALAWGGMVHAELRTRSLAIVGPSGEIVATLTGEEHGPLLRMRSEATGGSLVLGDLAGDLGLAISDAKQPRVHLLAGEKGLPSLTMSDEAGRTRLIAGLTADGDGSSPSLMLFDADRRARIVALVRTDARLLVRDEQGNPPLDAPPAIGPVTGETKR